MNIEGRQLLEACREGDTILIQRLLSTNRLDVNQIQDDYERTPVYIACRAGKADVVKLLLKYGAHFHKRSKAVCTALDQANEGIAHILLDHVPSMDAPYGDLIFLQLLRKGKVGYLRYLLEKKEYLSYLHKNNFPPLRIRYQDKELQREYRSCFSQIRIESLECLELLLDEYKLSMDFKDDYGNTLLYKICVSIRSEYFGSEMSGDDDYKNNVDKLILTLEKLLRRGAQVDHSLLHVACEMGSQKVIEILLQYGANINAQNKRGQTPLYVALYESKDVLVRFLLAQAGIILDTRSFDLLEQHQQEYGKFVDAFTQQYLNRLEEDIANFNATYPNGIFDFIDDDGAPDTEKSIMGFYILRHLIRCSEPNELSQLARQVNIFENIERLLNIPSVKDLVVLNATCYRLPESYRRNGDRRFASEENSLLRVAFGIGNQTVVDRLLIIPIVRERAEGANYYYGQHGLNLENIIQNRESSMRNLSPQEYENMESIKKTYEKMIKEEGGVAKVIGSFKDFIKEKYLTDKRARTVTLNGTAYVLPFEWDALQSFLNEFEWTAKQQQTIYENYYNNIYHTAYRYLSKPNRWMSSRASYVYVSDDRQERWSTFEEHQPLIAYLWLAAKDNGHPPQRNEGTVEERVELFIRQIALINRAHNWDKTRTVENANGEILKEEYDDLGGDKPSCFSGVKSRLFQALLNHPLYQPLDANIVYQFIRENTHAHYHNVLSSYDGSQLERLQEQLEDYFYCLGDKPDVNDLDFQGADVQRIKAAFISKFGEKSTRIFIPVIDSLFFKGTIAIIPEDFLRFYNSVNLGELLKLMIRTYPLREIIDEQAKQYLVSLVNINTHSDMLQLNATFQQIEENGVECIWEIIKNNVIAATEQPENKIKILKMIDDNGTEDASLESDLALFHSMKLLSKTRQYFLTEISTLLRKSNHYLEYCANSPDNIASFFWYRDNTPIPELEPPLEDIFVRDAILYDYQKMLSSYTAEQYDRLQEDVKNYLQSPEESPAIADFNLHDDTMEKIQRAFLAKFGNQRLADFMSIHKRILQFNNNQRWFFRYINVEELFQSMLTLYPLRDIINNVAVDYLVSQIVVENQEQLLQLDAHLKHVAENGVGDIWDKIKDKVVIAGKKQKIEDKLLDEDFKLFRNVKLMPAAKRFLLERITPILRENKVYIEYCIDHFKKAAKLFCQPELNLMLLIKQADKIYQEKGKSSSGRKSDVKQWVAACENLDEQQLINKICDRFNQKGHGWNEYSFNGLVAWHIYKFYQGVGLKYKQQDIFNGLPKPQKGIRHNCNHFRHGKRAIGLFCQALEQECLAREEPQAQPRRPS